MTVHNSTAHNLTNQGLWYVSGEDVNDIASTTTDYTVDGFTSNASLVLGPNESFTGSSTDEHLWYTRVRNVTVSYNPSSGSPLQGVRVNLGAYKSRLDNITIVPQSGVGNLNFTIGLGPTNPERPLNRIHWRNYSGPNAVSIVQDNPECVGKDVWKADCLGDIGGETNSPDGAVNVADLLAVISQWGTCPAPPPYPTTGTVASMDCDQLRPCHADIVPQGYGDDKVNVADLLAVIMHWGAYPTAFNEGGGGTIPRTIQECFTNICAGAGGSGYQSCIEKCINAVCTANPSACE